jgi:hypothetical protein
LPFALSDDAFRTSYERAGVVGFHDVVTRACCGLESGAIEDCDDSARVSDQATGLETLGGEGHGRAARTEHLPEEFVRELESVQADAIVRH